VVTIEMSHIFVSMHIILTLNVNAYLNN